MSVLGLRVDSKDYEFYRDELLRREREYVLSVLRATFKQLIEELRRKRGAVGAPPSEAPQREVVLRIEQVQRVEESEVLKLYRRIQHLERELSRALSELAEAKDQLERERSERQRCAQELESLRKKPEDLARQVAELKGTLEGYQLAFNVLRYCMESGDCDPAKLNDYLRSKMSKVPYQRPPDSILAIVRRPK